MTVVVVETSPDVSTTQTIIDGLRHSLNDDDKIRWPDSELIVYLNEWLERAKIQHPVFFFGLYDSLPQNLALGDLWPLDNRYVPACRYFIIARAHGKDTEEAYASMIQSYFGLSEASV